MKDKDQTFGDICEELENVEAPEDTDFFATLAHDAASIGELNKKRLAAGEKDDLRLYAARFLVCLAKIFRKNKLRLCATLEPFWTTKKHDEEGS